jgi:hypothetical protein
MSNIPVSGSNEQKPATPATPQQQTQSTPAKPQQQAQGAPAKLADKPSEQQK